MTKLIFERTKPCSDLQEPDMKTESIQGCECPYKTNENQENIQSDTFQRTIYKRKFSCPSLEFFRDNNPMDCDPVQGQNQFVRERSVDSDAGDFTSAESVVETLDKLNGINTVIDNKKRKNKLNRKCYGGPANLLVGSSSRYFKDFRRDDVYKAKIQQLIEKKVLMNTKYAHFREKIIFSQNESFKRFYE